MRKTAFSLFTFIGICVLAHAQKVQIKSDVVYVDKKEYLKINDSYGKDLLTTLSGKEFASVSWESFDVPNPARNNPNNPQAHQYPATIKKWYAVVTFLDFDLAFETDITKKQLFEALYENKVVDEQGTVSEENARLLAKKIASDVSSTKPTVIITH